MSKHHTNPDDPCGCKSGKRFGDCHGLIFAAPKGKAIGVAQQMYAKSWSVNSEHYEAQGLYAELASELVGLGTIRSVLDVGCGLGQGLKALSKAIVQPGRLIVGIDENADCLQVASEKLAIPATGAALSRIRSKIQLSGYYASEVAAAPLKLEGEVLLINVDLMVADPAFEAWLDSTGQFDAVTMWFSGVHGARSMTKVSQRVGAESDADLREVLEDQVMEFAVKRLRVGGIVQLVQRFAGDVEAVRKQRAAEVISALSDYPFELIGMNAHIYSEPTSDKGMAVNSVFADLSGRTRFALSTIMRKQENSDARA